MVNEIAGAGNEKALLSVRDLSEILGLGERTLWRHATTGKLPRPVSIGRLQRWRASDIRLWIAAGCPDRPTWELMGWEDRP